MTTAAGGHPKDISAFGSLLRGKLHTLLYRKFYALGLSVAFNPKLVILSATLFALICVFGVLNLRVDSDTIGGFTGTSSDEPFVARQYIKDTFYDGGPGEAAALLLTMSHPDGRAFEDTGEGAARLRETLLAAAELEYLMHNMQVAIHDTAALGREEETRLISLRDVCGTIFEGGPCGAWSVLDLWRCHNGGVCRSDLQSLKERIQNDGDLFRTLSARGFSNDQGMKLSQETFLGGCVGGVGAARGRCKQEARGMRVHSFRSMQSATFVFNSSGPDYSTWEQAWLETIDFKRGDVWSSLTMADGVTKFSDKINLDFILPRSFKIETLRSALPNIFLLVAAVIAMATFTLIDFVRFPLRESLVASAIMGVVGLGLALFVGLGVYFALGFPFNVITAICPFLVLAIGIDDMFVIVSEYETSKRKFPSAPIEHVVAHGLASAGTACMITTLTDVAAFFVGMSIAYTSVREWCFSSAVCLLACLLYQCTFFVAVLTLDAKRAERRRARRLEEASAEERAAEPPCQPGLGAALVERIVGWYTAQLRRTAVKRGVLVAFALLAASSTFEVASKFDATFHLSDLFADDCYLLEFADRSTTDYDGILWGQSDVIVHEGTDYELEGTRSAMRALYADMSRNDSVFITPDSWFMAYENFLVSPAFNATIASCDPSEFYSCFGLFHSLFASYWDDIVLDEATGKIKVSRLTALQQSTLSPGTVELKREATALEARSKERGLEIQVHSIGFFWALMLNNVVVEVFSTIGMLVAVVLVLMWLFFGTQMATIALGSVFLISLDVVAWLFSAGRRLSPPSGVVILMAIGMAVDYVSHIVYGYMVHDGSREERVAAAAREMGPVVLKGGLTTILGVLFLGLKNAAVYHMFRAQVSWVAISGLLHGMVFVPVVLSTIGPQTAFTAGAEHPSAAQVVQDPEHDAPSAPAPAPSAPQNDAAEPSFPHPGGGGGGGVGGGWGTRDGRRARGGRSRASLARRKEALRRGLCARVRDVRGARDVLDRAPCAAALRAARTRDHLAERLAGSRGRGSRADPDADRRRGRGGLALRV